MGSDLYMEQQNWRPRPNIVEWLDEETIKIQRDAFYTGYFTVYEGRVTPEVETLLKGLGIKLPKFVEPVLHVDQKFRVKITGPDNSVPGDHQADELYEQWYDSLHECINKHLGNAARDIMEEFPELKVVID